MSAPATAKTTSQAKSFKPAPSALKEPEPVVADEPATVSNIDTVTVPNKKFGVHSGKAVKKIKTGVAVTPTASSSDQAVQLDSTVVKPDAPKTVESIGESGLVQKTTKTKPQETKSVRDMKDKLNTRTVEDHDDNNSSSSNNDNDEKEPDVEEENISFEQLQKNFLKILNKLDQAG